MAHYHKTAMVDNTEITYRHAFLLLNSFQRCFERRSKYEKDDN